MSIASATEREFTDQVVSDPLKALLKTASESVGPTEASEPVDMGAAIREMKEDNRIENDLEIEAAIREMKEDIMIKKPKSISRGNSPRILTRSSRVHLRGRNGQRNPTQRVISRKESNPSFRSFPVRQGTKTGTASQTNIQTTTTRPPPRQRFETRPAVLPAQSDFATTEFFKDFDFTPSENNPSQLNLVTEAPRSAFQLDQNFRSNNQNVIANQ